MAPKSDDPVVNAEKEKTEPPKKKTKEQLKKENQFLYCLKLKLVLMRKITSKKDVVCKKLVVL